MSVSPRIDARRGLALVLALAALAVLCAGLAEPAHLSGPRWYPHIGGKRHNTPPPTTPKVTIPKLPIGRSQRSQAPHASHLILWIVGAAAAILVAWLLWRWWRRRSLPSIAAARVAAAPATSTVVPEPEPDAPVLLSGIELALRALDEHREPSDAIVRAWLGLQETAETAGIVRQASETPAEFTARMLTRALGDDRAIRTLLGLYQRTRFGNHPVTEDDVAQARQALGKLRDSWHADGAGGPSPHSRQAAGR